jgi:hypothetical protein
VTFSLAAGPPARPGDRIAARRRLLLVREELPRIRAAALAWRNGVAGLLAGIVGFGLVKGRTDVGQLASPHDAVVGGLLLTALLVGTIAALHLLRAAHGRPVLLDLRDQGQGGDDPTGDVDHAETLAAARALLRGLVLALICGAFLCAAVGLTWYGPAKASPRLQVTTPSGAHCGEVVRLESGQLRLKTRGGEIQVDLTQAMGLRPVDACPTGVG